MEVQVTLRRMRRTGLELDLGKLSKRQNGGGE